LVATTEISHGTYCFTQYVRVVLPLDGYAFWVRTNLVSPRALYNAIQPNSVSYNEWSATPPPVTVNVKGTLHYATTEHQDQEKTYSSNRVTFNTMYRVEEFNAVNQNMIWIGEFRGVRYAFGMRENFFAQAGEYHYIGDALYSVMETQVIDDVSQFDQFQVVSNSLPIWMSFNGYQTFYGIQQCPIPIYPSYLVPSNLRPPFAAVHVIPEATTALGAAPFLGTTLSHYQLTRDLVRVTLYGASNRAAMDFMDFVNQYTLDTDCMGIMNMPIVRDEKEAQVELMILAKKKSAEFEVSYYQQQSRSIARQLILSAVPTFIVADSFAPLPPPVLESPWSNGWSNGFGG
jgi:hypothetical protein